MTLFSCSLARLLRWKNVSAFASDFMQAKCPSQQSWQQCLSLIWGRCQPATSAPLDLASLPDLPMIQFELGATLLLLGDSSVAPVSNRCPSKLYGPLLKALDLLNLECDLAPYVRPEPPNRP